MALDKLVDSTQLDSDLTSVADAIRAKSGGSSQLAFPAGFVSEIGNIPSGGGGGNPIEKTVYTHAQDWLSDSTGNTEAFKKTYFTKGAGMYYVTIENNNATGNYKAVSAIAATGNMLTEDDYIFGRLGGNVYHGGVSWSYYITAGAIVSVWFIPKGAFV